jgi:plastocyanin
MFRARAMSIIPLVFVLASCGGSSGGTEPPPPPTGGNQPGPGGGTGPSVTVTVSNNAYTPDQVTVTRGATVTWQWDSCTGGDPHGGGQTCTSHSVTFDDGGASASLRSEGSFSRAFPTAGTFTYHCSAHATMTGRVIAQ